MPQSQYNSIENLRKNPLLAVVVGGIAIYTGYYIFHVCRKPKIYSKSARLVTLLREKCSVLNEPFRPTFWAFSTRLQTILAARLKSFPAIEYVGELVEMKDGGVLRLDWATGCETSSNRIVLVSPGLTGTSRSNYALHLVQQAKEKGFQAVVMNNRGLAGTPVRTARAFCAANSDDLEKVIKHVQKTKPNATILAVGTSLGGMILTNYLVRKGVANEDTGLMAAMVVSIPWDVFKGTNSLESTLNYYLFNRYLTNKLIELCKENYKHLIANYAHVPIPFDVHYVARSKSIQEFDESFIAPMFGYRNAKHYYQEATLITKPLHKINIPLLCLNAIDDVFAPVDTEVTSVISQCPNVALVTTTHGGHVAFLDGMFPTDASFMDRLFGQYIEAVSKTSVDSTESD